MFRISVPFHPLERNMAMLISYTLHNNHCGCVWRDEGQEKGTHLSGTNLCFDKAKRNEKSCRRAE